MDNIIINFSKLQLYDEQQIVKIQKWYRGCLYRLKRLPLIMYKIKKYLNEEEFYFTTKNNDGRLNSSLDEKKIIDILSRKFKIKIPNIRMWYDILVYDYICGFIPVNIKITTMKTNDNTGNLTMCLYSYTDEKLDMDKSYKNGEISKILVKKLEEKKYNMNNKKDYYFLVINKNNKNIIINSVKGLNILTPNLNNIPYQVYWNKNKEFVYKSIKKNIEMFINCIKQQKINWKETFVQKMRLL